MSRFRFAFTLALPVMATGALADNKVTWTGPGWYLAQSSTESAGVLLGSAELIGGPYPTENACIAAKPRDENGQSYLCVNADAPDFAVRTATPKPKTK